MVELNNIEESDLRVAVDIKNVLDYEGLKYYDEKIKEEIDSRIEDAIAPLLLEIATLKLRLEKLEAESGK